MMLENIEYIFRGIVHFFIISFEFFDYIEQVLIGILILFFIGIAIWDRKFLKAYLNIGKSFLKMVISPFGIILFITMAGYYLFSIFAFDENINILIIIITLVLFSKDLFEFMNNSILNESNKTIKSIIKISKSVFILFFYRLFYIIELGSFDELDKVFYSLIFVPIIAIIIIIMKILTTVETINVRFCKVEKLQDIEYLKLFIVVLIKKRSINNTNKVINNFFQKNRQLSYNETKNKIINFENISNDSKNNKPKIKNSIEKRKVKIKSVWFILWVANIITIIYSILEKRIFNIDFNAGYYISLIVLSIYFFIDVMKIYNIKCQYDFVIYFIISVVEFIILFIYYIKIQNGRLSNMLFLIIIYIIIAFLFRRIKTMKFLEMPFLSEKNFFGLPVNKSKTIKLPKSEQND